MREWLALNCSAVPDRSVQLSLGVEMSSDAIVFGVLVMWRYNDRDHVVMFIGVLSSAYLGLLALCACLLLQHHLWDPNVLSWSQWTFLLLAIDTPCHATFLSS